MNAYSNQYDRELTLLLKQGSSVAFKSLFDTYSQKIFRFSLQYLKSDTEAEEIVQEVFMKVWQNRQNLKTDTSIQAYIFKIAFNAILKHFNSKARREKYQHDIFISLAEESPSLDNHTDYEVLLQKLEVLISEMPERRREIFLKRKKEGKSVREIAQTMQISEKTVENQITEAMHYLKEAFREQKLSGELFIFLFIA